MKFHRRLQVVLATAAAGMFVGTGIAQAESLLMSGHYSAEYGAINLPLLDNIAGSGFVSVTGAGTKKTVVVPPGVFNGGGMNTFPVPGNSVLQQIFTSFVGSAPALGAGSATLAPGLTPSRPNTSFAFCPGMTVASCMDHRSTATGAPPGSGTEHGLVRYTNSGAVFSGTMQGFLAGIGALSHKIGLTPRFSHVLIGGSATQAFAGPYQGMNVNFLTTGPITTGAVLGGTTASGGVIVSPGVFLTNASTGVSNENWGFPLTIGSVYARHTKGPAAGTLKSAVGSHNTHKGRGTITMVATGVTNDLLDGPGTDGFPHLVTVTLDISSSQLTPALSPVGIAAMAGLMITAGGYMLRRSMRKV